MMLFVAGARFWHICAVVLAGVPAVLLAVATTSYRRLRILGFLNLAQHRQDLGYQSYQALIGLGNGGLFGVGLGGAERKMFYLPEPHTDFVFSILGEEIGFVGLLVVLFIYSFMIYRGIRIAMRASDKMGQCMAAGLTVALGSYVLIHAAVNAGLLPTTGVPLPFLSYGGASLVFTMSAMGILLNISSQTRDMTLPVQRQRPQPRRAAKKTVAGRRMR
jgi:cell division protein FtsW